MYVLTPELENAARENCNESKEIRETSLVSLKAWLKKTPHLKSRTNDELLLSFLRCCRFSLEDTKKRIDGFYSLKNVFPEVLLNRIVNDSLMDLYRQGYVRKNISIFVAGLRFHILYLVNKYTKF